MKHNLDIDLAKFWIAHKLFVLILINPNFYLKKKIFTNLTATKS